MLDEYVLRYNFSCIFKAFKLSKQIHIISLLDGVLMVSSKTKLELARRFYS
jgi:hypothetical protein